MNCEHCGQALPTWDDLPAAIAEALESTAVPNGLRPMLIQAATEIRNLEAALKQVGVRRGGS
jgi:hypothetical protein